MITRRRLTSWALYLLAMLLFCLVVVESSLRAGLVRPSFHYPFGMMEFRIYFDREVLFKVLPNSSPEINGHGYRDTEFGAKERGKKRILFLGDSFVMGMSTPSAQTIPNELERILGSGFEVFNLGVYGYGPDQSFVQLMDEGLGFEPDLLVLALFPSNDFRDLRFNRPFEIDAEGSLAATHTNAVTAVIPPLDALYLLDYLLFRQDIRGGYFNALFTALHQDRFDFDLYEGYDERDADPWTGLMRALVRRFKEELAERGVEFLAVVIPYGPLLEKEISRERALKPFYLETLTAGILQTENIPAINLFEHFLAGNTRHPRLYRKDWGGEHLNAAGHQLTARIVKDYMKKNGILF